MYKKMLGLIFCFGSLVASEPENLKLHEKQDRFNAMQARLAKNLESIDVMIELKFIKSMVGLVLYAIVLEYCGKMPSSRLGYLGVVCIGLLSSLPLSTMLIAASEGYALTDLKKKLEVERSQLESSCTEQDVSA